MASARAELKTVISADSSQFSTAMRRAGMVASETGSKIRKSLGLAAAPIAKMVAVAGAAALAFKGVQLAASAESTAVAFETLLGSADAASSVLKDLKKLGAETPFEFPELADAGRKLIAFGESGATVTETLRRIGDVSAGVQAPISEIAEIYGKARVQGRLFAEDINQLTGRGIPIIGELAKQFGVSESEVKNLVESGKVGFPELEKAFISLTSAGGKFNGMMEKQSKTTLGLFSTLQDSIKELLTKFGEPINDAIKPVLEKGIELASRFGGLASEMGEKFAGMIDLFMGMIESMSLSEIFQYAGLVLKNAFIESLNILAKGVQAIFAMFKSGELGDAFSVAGLKLQRALSLAAADIIESLEPILGERANVAADFNRATADLRSAEIEALEAEGGRSFFEAFSDEFKKSNDILKMPKDDKAALDEFGKRINEAAEKFTDTRKGTGIPAPPKPVPQIDGTTYGPPKPATVPQIDGTTYGPAKSLMQRQDGLASAIDRYRSIGQDNAFSRDRARLGIASGLTTGGLGEKRRLATSKDQREAKKALSAQEAQLDKLSSIDTNIKQALTVA